MNPFEIPIIGQGRGNRRTDKTLNRQRGHRESGSRRNNDDIGFGRGHFESIDGHHPATSYRRTRVESSRALQKSKP